MISYFKKRIKNIVEVIIEDKRHSRWISLINKYYKNSVQDPANTEIYLQKLLNRGGLDIGAQNTVNNSIIRKEKEDVTDYTFIEKEGCRFANTADTGDRKHIIKEVLNEIEKYLRILSHKKF